MGFRKWRKYQDAKWAEEKKAFQAVLDKYSIPRPACMSEIGLGWIPVFDECMGKLVALDWDRQLDQVKQKFCELVIYASRCNTKGELVDGISKAINEALAKANTMCENCGAPHGLQIPRGGQALCPTCSEQERAIYKDE